MGGSGRDGEAMKEEIAAAVFFVARLVKRYGCLDNQGRERFATALTSALFESYRNHWHPKAPTKGQAYRSGASHHLPAHSFSLLGLSSIIHCSFSCV